MAKLKKETVDFINKNKMKEGKKGIREEGNWKKKERNTKNEERRGIKEGKKGMNMRRGDKYMRGKRRMESDKGGERGKR